MNSFVIFFTILSFSRGISKFEDQNFNVAMNKKKILTPFLLVCFGTFFILVCLAVFISGGKSKKWIARKMKIGGFLLSLTTITTGAGCITCYDMPEPLLVSIDGSNGYEVEIKPDTGNILTGVLYMPRVKNFSFAISDIDGQNKQTDRLNPSDGEFGENTESFYLEIDKTIPFGNYHLKMFDCDTPMLNNAIPFKTFYLKIKNE